jgi:hypothetical protein
LGKRCSSDAMSIICALAVVLLLTSCDRAIEPFVPGEKPERPDLARIFPEGAAPSRAGPPASLPPAPPTAMPDSGSAPEAIRGVVRIADEIADAIPEGATLFVIARGEGGGPPLAVKRVASPHFPLAFELGPEDRMIQTRPFRGPLQLSAWLDQDGNVTTRVAGDLQGSAPGRFDAGARGVEIIVDQVL